MSRSLFTFSKFHRSILEQTAILPYFGMGYLEPLVTTMREASTLWGGGERSRYSTALRFHSSHSKRHYYTQSLLLPQIAVRKACSDMFTNRVQENIINAGLPGL